MPRTPKTRNSASAHKRRHQRLASHTVTSPEVVKEIMFLFAVGFVPRKNYNKAVNLVRAIWRDGYAIGAAVEKRKGPTLRRIKAILRRKVSVANDGLQRPGVEKQQTRKAK